MGFTALKIAVVAPMPNARVRTAIKVKPGCFKRFLIAKRVGVLVFVLDLPELDYVPQ